MLSELSHTAATLAEPVTSTRRGLGRQDWRRVTQTGFFLLFLLAPALNLLRFDMTQAQLWFLGFRWSLGIDALARGEINATTAALQLLWRTFLTALGLVAIFITIAYRYGRFCRFGCAVGYFQSLAWMANPKGMVVAFERERAKECKTCGTQPLDPVPGSSPEGSTLLGAARRAAPVGSACDNACPMRLKPRNIKRMLFSCVQCGLCLDACETSQGAQQRNPTRQEEP